MIRQHVTAVRHEAYLPEVEAEHAAAVRREAYLPEMETAQPTDPPGELSAQPLARRLLTNALVLLFFAILSVIATWPLFPQMGGYVMDKGDPLYSVWAMAWQAHALVANPLGLFDSNIMYPFHGTLAFDELSFAEAVLAAPLYFVTGNPVLSHNAMLFLTFALSGWATWLLVRELTGSSSAGIVAGATFAFCFYRMNHLPHMTLDSTQWLPLTLLAAYKLLWTGRWRWACALGGFFALQALSGHYLAFYTAMLLGLFLLYYAFARRDLFSLLFLGKFATGMAASLLFILPVAVPYVLLQGGNGFSRNLFEVERFSNTLSSFLAVFRGNPLLRAALAPFGDPGPWSIERAAFPGIFTLLLAVVGLLFALRAGRATVDRGSVERSGAGDLGSGPATRVSPPSPNGSISSVANLSSSNPNPSSPNSPYLTPNPLSRHALFYAIAAVLSALLSLGPTLQLTYAESNYDPSAIKGVLPLPYRLLHDYVPGFQSMRVVARIDVLTALSLSVLAGIGAFYLLPRIAGALSSRMRRGTALPGTPSLTTNHQPIITNHRSLIPVVALLLALLPVAESWSTPISMEAVGTRGAVPQVYRWLQAQPPTVYLEYPMTYYKHGDPNVEMANLYQYYSAYSWQRTINASTSIRPFAYSALVQETDNCFPCPRSLDALSLLGVEYVVVHLGNLSDPQRTDFLWRSTNPAGKVVNDFTLVQTFGDDRIYKLKLPREVAHIRDLIPRGASILLGDVAHDPDRVGDATVAGGYMAGVGYFLRDHPEYGDTVLSYGQEIKPYSHSDAPTYAILWANQDPATVGFDTSNKLWANEHVALYRRAGIGAR
ncbi:MAG: hypothetical protein M3014_09685 [Chloroflexota bacterium]|nr:hypothetical protein [Chloroflexota bacterium]